MYLDHQDTPVKKSSIYGSFLLDNSEYALSVESIQEVINEPSEYTTIPFTQPYVLGLLSLRDIIVTVIDLRRVFNTDEVNNGKLEGVERKIAIIEQDSCYVGLVFDKTSEVFNSNDVVTCWFESQEASEPEQVMQGVFKMEEGRRIVKILDGLQIVNLGNIPRISNPKRGSGEHLSQGVRKQCVTFGIGEVQCALDISSINETVNIDKVSNKILAHGICMGTIDIRGSTVPVINSSALLGFDDEYIKDFEKNDSSRVIVMTSEDQRFGLLVNSLKSIVSYHQDDIANFPVLGDKDKSMFAGCIASTEKSEQTILLNHENILSSEDIVAISKRNRIFQKSTAERSQKKRDKLVNRSSMITFKLNILYGLDMKDVREVINYPTDTIRSANLPNSLAGMINLRDELIAVIDTRKLYNMENSDVNTVEKVLIFTNNGMKWGLLVDSVDSIVPFDENDLVDIPQFMFNGDDSLISKDVKKTVIVKSESRSEPVSVLDLALVATRVNQ